jgi:hypothetical protein
MLTGSGNNAAITSPAAAIGHFFTGSSHGRKR